MKKLSPIFAACLLGFCAVASATTYECTDRQGLSRSREHRAQLSELQQPRYP